MKVYWLTILLSAVTFEATLIEEAPPVLPVQCVSQLQLFVCAPPAAYCVASFPASPDTPVAWNGIVSGNEAVIQITCFCTFTS